MPTRDLVVVGASAGGVEALRTLVAGLTPELPAAVLVVLHVPPFGGSALPGILARAGELPVRHAHDGDALTLGTVLVAPPDRHLLVVDGRVALSAGPRENGHRPAVDVLFRTAARVFGPRVVGVVLSGALDDGSAGLVAIGSRGGVGVVQRPDDALHGGMPASAIEAARPEHVAPVVDIPRILAALIRESVDLGSAPPPSALMRMETAMAGLDPYALHGEDRPGNPSGFSCPDCHGVLFRIEEGGLVRFRCRVGHAWSVEGLVAQQGAALESALWLALRNLQEKAALCHEMSRRAAALNHEITSERFAKQAEEAGSAAALLRDLLARAGADFDEAMGGTIA